MKKPRILYVERGIAFRTISPFTHSEHIGYQRTGSKKSYPLLTKAECQADARARGAVAEFRRIGESVASAPPALPGAAGDGDST